jgi:hypothetical protein
MPGQSFHRHCRFTSTLSASLLSCRFSVLHVLTRLCQARTKGFVRSVMTNIPGSKRSQYRTGRARWLNTAISTRWHAGMARPSSRTIAQSSQRQRTADNRTSNGRDWRSLSMPMNSTAVMAEYWTVVPAHVPPKHTPQLRPSRTGPGHPTLVQE